MKVHFHDWKTSRYGWINRRGPVNIYKTTAFPATTRTTENTTRTSAIEVNLTKNQISSLKKETATEIIANPAITRTTTTTTQTITTKTQTNITTTPRELKYLKATETTTVVLFKNHSIQRNNTLNKTEVETVLSINEKIR